MEGGVDTLYQNVAVTGLFVTKCIGYLSISDWFNGYLARMPAMGRFDSVTKSFKPKTFVI